MLTVLYSCCRHSGLGPAMYFITRFVSCVMGPLWIGWLFPEGESYCGIEENLALRVRAYKSFQLYDFGYYWRAASQ